MSGASDGIAARLARADRAVLLAAIRELLAVWDTSADDLDSLWAGLSERVEVLRVAAASMPPGKDAA